jgi:hypothetical protein
VPSEKRHSKGGVGERVDRAPHEPCARCVFYYSVKEFRFMIRLQVTAEAYDAIA